MDAALTVPWGLGAQLLAGQCWAHHRQQQAAAAIACHPTAAAAAKGASHKEHVLEDVCTAWQERQLRTRLHNCS